MGSRKSSCLLLFITLILASTALHARVVSVDIVYDLVGRQATLVSPYGSPSGGGSVFYLDQPFDVTSGDTVEVTVQFADGKKLRWDGIGIIQMMIAGACCGLEEWSHYHAVDGFSFEFLGTGGESLDTSGIVLDGDPGAFGFRGTLGAPVEFSGFRFRLQNVRLTDYSFPVPSDAIATYNRYSLNFYDEGPQPTISISDESPGESFMGTGNTGSGVIRLLEARVNGRTVDMNQRLVRVFKGQAVTGSVRILTDNFRDPGDVVPLGYTWTWGSRDRAFKLISQDIPSGQTEWTVNLNLSTKNVNPGDYNLLFGFNGEFTLEQVMSNHNWQAGPVLWNDGNDYHDIQGSRRLRFIRENGYLWNWFYRNPVSDAKGVNKYGSWSIPVDYLTVRVTP